VRGEVVEARLEAFDVLSSTTVNRGCDAVDPTIRLDAEKQDWLSRTLNTIPVNHNTANNSAPVRRKPPPKTGRRTLSSREAYLTPSF
jgi:hypothetical protein